MRLRYFLLVILSFLAVGLAGCCAPHAPAPAAPAGGWQDLKTNPSIPPLQAGVDVMIAYGNSGCMHAAMWIAAPGEPLLFWDPAGGYGVNPPNVLARQRDVIATAPSLETYLDFRWGIGTEAVEVFRFRLRPETVGKLYRLLRDGAKGKSPYNPSTPGLFCSHAISGFLAQYAPEDFPLERSYIYPHDFAEQLYRLNFEQVILVYPEGPAKTLLKKE